MKLVLTCRCWLACPKDIDGEMAVRSRSVSFGESRHFPLVALPIAQWQSERLLTARLQVQVLLGQPFIAEWTTWKVAVSLNHGDAGSTPASASNLMPCGVTGNIPLFESEDSRFKPWRGSWEVNSRLGQSPVFLPFLTPVAQLEEAAVSKTVMCGFDPHQEYQTNSEL